MNRRPENAEGRFYNISEKKYSSKDILSVGPEKPVGFLTLRQIEESGADFDTLVRESKAKGLTCVLFGDGQSMRKGSVLYVYDASALQVYLDKNMDILRRYGWPVTPREYIRKIARKLVKREQAPDLYALIARSFNDKRFTVE